MKKLLFSIGMILLSAISLYSQTCEWVEKIAGNSSDYAQKVKVDGNGNIYVVGYFTSSTLNFNNGKSLAKNGGDDSFMAKYNSNGTCQWAEKIAGTDDDNTYDVAIGANGNIYVVGYFTSSTLNFNNGKSLINSGGNDGFLTEYNSEGICQWAEKIAGTGDDFATSVKTDGNGNVYVTGSFSSSALNFNNGKSLINSGDRDGFIAKFNSEGICQWTEKIAGIDNDYIHSVAVDVNENVYVSGSYNSPILTLNNNITLGETESGYYYAYFAKYNSSGVCQWAKKIPGDGSSSRSVTVDSNGDLLITGEFLSDKITFNNGESLLRSGSYDGYLAKFNSSGICQWAEKIAGTKEDFIETAITDVNGNINIAGEFTSSQLTFNNGKSLQNNGDWDGFIAEYNSEGICQWAERIAGTSSDGVHNITVDENGNLIVVGDFYSSLLTFNNDKSLSRSGASDGFIAKYSKLTPVIETNSTTNHLTLNIKPNPASDIAEIEYCTPNYSNTEINIYSLDGELLDKIQNLTSISANFNTCKLSAGEYNIVMSWGKEKLVRKLVVVR